MNWLRRLDALERDLGLDWQFAWSVLYQPVYLALRDAIPLERRMVVRAEAIRVLSQPDAAFSAGAVAWFERHGCSAAGWREFFAASEPYLPQRHVAHPPLHHPHQLPAPPPEPQSAVNACVSALSSDDPEGWGWAVFWLWSLLVARAVRQLHAHR